MTAGRRVILDHALRQPGHFDAEGLLSALRDGGARVSRATVYRTLGRLAAAGLLRRHRLRDRESLYESVETRPHHEHLVCTRCGAIQEFVQDDIEALQDEVCSRYGFRASSHTLQIRGICRSCLSGAPEPGSPS